MQTGRFKPDEFHRHLEALAREPQGRRELNDRDPMERDYFRLLEDAGFVESTTTQGNPGSPLGLKTVARITASGRVALRVAERGRQNAFDLYEEILFGPDVARR